jgi:predicted Rossmann fold flavoprotein
VTPPIITQPASHDPGLTPDVVVVGGGAAGLAASIFAARAVARQDPLGKMRPRFLILDGARKLGAKILVSGGSRCNVTNVRVEASDFWRAGSPFVRQVLRALPVPQTLAFFEEIGVNLKEEPLGKLFPVTNKSATVLDGLVGEARRLNVDIQTSCRVTGLKRDGAGWSVETSAGPLAAPRVVLAAGGLSLPKTGSDGLGYELARAHGHTIVAPVPALEPLILAGDFHPPLSGIAHEASIRFSLPQQKPVDVRGSLLWTHFGISGPLALNVSRFFRRAKAEGASASLRLSFVPGLSEEDVEQKLREAVEDRAQTHVGTEISRAFGLAQAISLRIVAASLGPDRPLRRLTRENRRELVRALTALPLEVVDGRGYNYAEVTSGGVSLDEVNPRSMESRLAPGLFFAGEILDVDGRIGGFNFQWAWATGKVAGEALARQILEARKSAS